MFNFKQKDDEFFDLFLESAKFFHAGALILDEVIQDYKTTAVKVEEINKIEHEADAINDRIIDKLNLTFITPIDREDIYALANNLDDGVDLLHGGANDGSSKPDQVIALCNGGDRSCGILFGEHPQKSSGYIGRIAQD